MTDRVGLETRPPEITRKSGVRSIIAQVDGDYYTTSEVAKELGVSVGTIRRWYRATELGLKAPSKKITRGKLTIYLYTEDDLEELRLFMNGETSND